MVDLKSIIDEELRKRISEARADGNEYLDVISGNIHNYLGFKSRMPSCCHAMKKMMRSGDLILSEPIKGKGATVKVRYFL